MRTFFVDTNFFLHCQDIEQIAWSDLAGTDNVLILISGTTRKELDRLKQAGNTRRANRARKATSLIRSLIDLPDRKMVLRESEPHIEIGLAPVPIAEDARHAILDPSQDDHAFVGEVLAYSVLRPGEDVCLISHDSNPVILGRECGLKCVLIPDSWMLKPETDDQDKKIAALQEEVKRLRKSYPEITVNAEDKDRNLISKVQFEIQTFGPLTDENIDQLLEGVRRRHPMATTFHNDSDLNYKLPAVILGLDRYEPPTQAEIEHYSTHEYPEWIEAVRKFLTQLPATLELPSRYTKLVFNIENHGSRPAHNVVVELEARRGILLSPPRTKGDQTKDEESQGIIRLPQPPSPPRGKRVGLSEMVRQITAISHGPTLPVLNLHGQKDDRHAFYYRGGRPIGCVTTISYICEEFRHRIGPTQIHVDLLIPPNCDIDAGALDCRVTATNLPEPIEVTLPVRVTYTRNNAIEEALKIIGR